MKTFRQFITEATQPKEGPNTRGVLIHAGKMFVGIEHGKTPQFSPAIQQMVQKHAKEHGHWDEGNGGDAPVTKPIVKGKSQGSWDEDLVSRDLYTDKQGKRFTPHHHLTSLFGNLSGSEQEKQLASTMSNKNYSVRDAIVKNQHKVFPDAPVRNPEKFFSALGKDYNEALDSPATPENMHKFIQKGAADTWHGNDNPDTPLGQMARQVQTDREDHLINKAPPGVYFIGSGHLPSMKKRLEDSQLSHHMIGGSTAHL